ncbi:hypothetical protein, partial [Ensifer aridi]|uniref:hypothetical protein n=1 Tax=Ensifer aridi TaxID=1708715 RepID=UPI001AECD705
MKVAGDAQHVNAVAYVTRRQPSLLGQFSAIRLRLPITVVGSDDAASRINGGVTDQSVAKISRIALPFASEFSRNLAALQRRSIRRENLGFLRILPRRFQQMLIDPRDLLRPSREIHQRIIA